MLGQFYIKEVPANICDRVNLKMKTDVKAGRDLCIQKLASLESGAVLLNVVLARWTERAAPH